MKFRSLILILIFISISGCVGYSSTGVLWHRGKYSVAMDPRTIGMQIDDSIDAKKFKSKIRY